MNKEEVKTWLKSIGQTRTWLAEQLNSEVKTVNNWLSTSRPIPARAEVTITKLMRQYPIGQKNPSDIPFASIILEVPMTEFDLWNEAAVLQGLTIRKWAETNLTKLADSELGKTEK